jgi:hypothetical protein
MKLHLKSKIGLLSCCLALAVSPALAVDSVNFKAIAQTLSSVPALELAPTAAKLVKEAPASQTDSMAREVVVRAIKLNSMSAIAVVGAIAKETPAMAPAAAATAAALKPKQAVNIAVAAATSAPAQAAKIVQAVCEAAPKQYQQVALAVANIVPSASKEILQAVAMAMLNLREKLENLAAPYGDNISVPTLALIFQQAEGKTAAPAAGPKKAVITPTPGPAFVPYGGTVQEITPAHNYSAP